MDPVTLLVVAGGAWVLLRRKPAQASAPVGGIAAGAPTADGIVGSYDPQGVARLMQPPAGSPVAAVVPLAPPVTARSIRAAIASLPRPAPVGAVATGMPSRTAPAPAPSPEPAPAGPIGIMW